MERSYICIDLKSFYASVECVDRGLDPMSTNLVVADPTRTEKTICLAVSPSMKRLGVKNRCRVFEIPKHIKYIMAPPRMQRYIDCAADIYDIYLEYISPDDMHVYSIDEVFIDVTPYLEKYGKTPKEMAVMLMNEIADRVGIRSTAGVGPNLYLAKIALDITAKHAKDFIGELNENSFQETLWDHRPLTDFWRIGHATSARLQRYGIYTMRDIARADPDLLYREFGIDAELMIDHAWGIEPTTIADIHNYVPRSSSISSGQVLPRDYSTDEGETVVREMTDLMCLDMVDKELLTGSMTLYLSYSNSYEIPHSSGSVSFRRPVNDDSIIMPGMVSLYRRIAIPGAPIRRVNISANNTEKDEGIRQLSLFDDNEYGDEENLALQRAILDLKKRFGSEAVLKGIDFTEGATTRERLHQIGGHKSGE